LYCLSFDLGFGIYKLALLNIENHRKVKDIINNENQKYCALLK